MNRKLWGVFAGVCAFGMIAVFAAPAQAQMSGDQMKPAEYCYVSFWTVPRPQWADMLKVQADDKANMDKMMADGTINAYGNDATLVHQEGESTHSDWMCGSSMGNLASVAASYIASPNQPAVYSASKHSDIIVESTMYNGHSGAFTDGYSRVSYWKLKKNAPNDAVEQLSKTLFVPTFEKLLAAGAIHNYGVYTEAIHTMDPGSFWVVFTAAGPDGLDKFNKAVGDMLKQNPLAGAAFDSMVDMSDHRDLLSRVIITVSK